jgi:hypothetical protein
MQQETYTQIRFDRDYSVFRFVSEGRHGSLIKIVSLDEIRLDIFNLSLGTILPNGEIDFDSITNNGDRNKILVTIANIVDIFLEKHPGKSVYIAGSDERRTLLYRRAIDYGYDYLIQKFYIYGDISTSLPATKFEDFNGLKSYPGFLVRQR